MIMAHVVMAYMVLAYIVMAVIHGWRWVLCLLEDTRRLALPLVQPGARVEYEHISLRRRHMCARQPKIYIPVQPPLWIWGILM